MYCQHCNQETEEGKFCTNCGKELFTDESAAAESSIIEAVEEEEPTNNEAKQRVNDFADQFKRISSEFGQFFLNLVKKPSNANKVNSNQLLSSLIMMGIFSLLISLSYYISLKSNALGFFIKISFFNNFIVPFAIFFILLIVIASITFIGIKLSGQIVSYRKVLTTYGAYLVPFSLLFILSVLFSLVGIISLTLLTLIISLMGILLIIPTLIIINYPTSGFDHIHLLIGVYLVTLFIFGFIIQTFLESVIGGLLGNMTGFF